MYSSLSFRITRLVVLLALASGALAAVATLRPLDRHLKAASGEQVFALLKLAAASIELQLEGKRAFLRAAAAQSGAGLARGEPPSSLLAGQAGLREEFSGALLLDAAGRVVASLAQADAFARPPTGIDARLRVLFRDGAGTASQAVLGSRADRPALFLVEPVRDAAGRVRYALAAILEPRAARIGGALGAPGTGSRGYFFIADLAGTIVHHPNRRRIMARLGGDAAGFEGWREDVDERGAPALLAFTRLRAVPWIVGAVHPVDDAFAGARTARAAAYFAASIAAIAVAAAGLVAALRILRPLEDLQRRVREHQAGEHDQHENKDESKDENKDEDEVLALGRAYFALARKCAAAEEKLARLAFTDALTGIANRRMLEETLAGALARGRRAGQVVAVAYLDIDRFKSINDSRGHPAGDAVLVEFAARLKTAVRSHDTVARLAGDEFMVILDGVTGVAEAADAAKRILDCLRTPFAYGGHSIRVTTSIGIALQQPQATQCSAELIGRADAALYRAKRDGRNRYTIDAGPVPAAPPILATGLPTNLSTQAALPAANH